MVEIDKVTLTLRLDATITVYDSAGNATDWIKPGSEAGVTWKGGIPSEPEVKLAYDYLNSRNSEALTAVIQETRKRLDESRRR